MNSFNKTRRDFIKTVGFGTVALSLTGISFQSDEKYKAKIGIQLYTIRKNIEKDFEGSIKKIADLGYFGIETYALPKNITLHQAGKVFKDNNLEIFSMHTELPIGKDREIALRMADAYNSKRLVYHGWPPGDKYKNKEALDRTVDMYNEMNSYLNTKGIKFGLHNHWFEFEKNEDGIYPFYYFLKNVDANIFFEIDTYWVKTAGKDPVKILKDFGTRAPLLHIKDGNAIKGEKSYEQVPAGQGVMDFPSIVNAGGENIKWMIVEFDEFEGDIFKGAEQSYKYLTKNNLAFGKS